MGQRHEKTGYVVEQRNVTHDHPWVLIDVCAGRKDAEASLLESLGRRTGAANNGAVYISHDSMDMRVIYTERPYEDPYFKNRGSISFVTPARRIEAERTWELRVRPVDITVK